jgi:DNA-binding transcriptional LysR family regulator
VELRQLEYFVAVARHGQFTRAADALWVTQSALSQQVARLEAELGVALFRRTPHGAELTPAGEDLFARAQSILAEVAAARAQLDRHAGVTRGRVRVAATTIHTPRLPRALAVFHREHPGLQVALRHGPSSEMASLVHSGAVDVAVSGARAELPSGVASEQLAEEPLRAMLPLGDPLGDGAAIAIGVLRERPFILAEPGSGLRETVMAACQAAGFSPVSLFEVSDPATVRHLVQAELGVSVVPASWFESVGADVARASLEPAPRHRVDVLTPAGGCTPAAELLVAALKAAFG